MRRGIKKEHVLQAIAGSKGIKLNIAKALGVQRQMIDAYFKKWPETREAFDVESERWHDEVENIIHKAIEDIDPEISLPMAKWYASRKLKHRGYGDESKVVGDSSQPITVKVVYESEGG